MLNAFKLKGSYLPQSPARRHDSPSYDYSKPNPVGNAYEVFGDVGNDDTVSIAFPEVAATLYNAIGQPIGCLSDSLNKIHLPAGEFSGFHLQTSVNTPSEEVVNYSLQVSGTRE